MGVGGLIIRTNDRKPDLESGDIISALSNRRILWVHGQHICRPWIINPFENMTGIHRRVDSLLYKWYECTHEYKFIRLNKEWVRRIGPFTNQSEIFGPIPNSNKEYIYVEQYIQNRLSHHRHRIFGEPGKEIWFGGAVNNGWDGTIRVWDMIESNTNLRRENYQYWPFGTEDKKFHLCIHVKELDDELSSIIVDSNTELPNNKFKINWEESLGLDTGRIRRIKDPSWSVDITGMIYDIKKILIEKKQGIYV